MTHALSPSGVTPPSNVLRHLYSEGLELTDEGIVRWRKGSTQHPRNWPISQKAYNAAIVIFLDFFMYGNPSQTSTREAHIEYKKSDTMVLFAFSSMYFLGQALGGVGFAPYSESFGRKPLYLFSTAIIAIFSIIIPTVHSLSAVFVGRFVTGFASAIPSIIAAGSIEDMFSEQTRLWLVSLWLITVNLSLVFGPIFAAYVAYSIETRATQILKQNVRKVETVTGQAKFQTENPDHVPNLRYFVKVVLFRPLVLLFTEPIVFITSLISGSAFALIYLFTEVLTIVYRYYGFSVRETSLAFVPIGIGFLCSIFTRLYDINLAAKFASRSQKLKPEDKLVGFAIASPAFAIGLWWFAWTIPPAVMPHWIVSMLALVPVGFAINEYDCVLVGYLTDSYTTYASSAFASLSLLRSLLSAVFPLFANKMYTSLGSNRATTILAAVATAFCFSPYVLIRYGSRIRGASKFAKYSLDVSRDFNTLHSEPPDASTVGMQLDE
ncbi:MAG: hypothetical protein M1831_000289 [Alyxoria varia]|nr:MAG: hypothetical protein M1831_000289 [Alyxoria varia]